MQTTVDQKVRPEREVASEQVKIEIKTNTESCEINSEISDGAEAVEASDVKTEDCENKVKRDFDNKVEGDSAEVTDSNGTPKINVNGKCGTASTEEKGTKDEESC